MALPQRISETAGDTWVWELSVLNAADDTPFLDLALCTVTVSVGAWSGSTNTGEVVVTDALAGEITVTVPAVDTALFSPGVYAGDVQVVVVANGQTRTPVHFRLTVLDDVSP